MKSPLRILLICQQDLGLAPHPLPAYRFWRGYFVSALTEAGHQVLDVPLCDWAAGLLPRPAAEQRQWCERTWTQALDWIRHEHARTPIDLVLSYLYPQQILPGAVAELRTLGLPVVNFFCDNVREFRAVPAEFRDFDLHWVPEFKAIPLYRQAGLPWINAPMPCWVPPNWRQPPASETPAITFIGTRDEQRERLFAAALRQGLEIELRGAGWESPATAPAAPPLPARNPLVRLQRQWRFAQQHGWPALARKTWQAFRPAPALEFDFRPHTQSAPVGDDYWRVLRECSVCVGVNRYPSLRFPLDQPDTYSRLRDIEAPMAGACYLTEWTEGLDQLYEPGREIETYRDADELVAKANALRADAPRRRKMRAAAQLRALQDHSIPRTIQLIAARLGGKLP